MVLQNANGQGCCGGRCCCPALVTPSFFLYPDDERERVVVEDVPDDEDEDLQEPISLLRNQTPPDGEWMEPIPTQSATTAAVPTVKENSCSAHGTKVLQQYSTKRNNNNRNRMRILRMIVSRGNENVPIAVGIMASTCMNVEAREVVRLAVTTLT